MSDIANAEAERLPTNEQIEAEVEGHMAALANLSDKDMREGYRHLLQINGFLRRSLVEAVTMARVVYVGYKGDFQPREIPKQT